LEYKLDGISDQSLVGATVLFKSQTTTENQPELGHEPFNQLLLGLNTRLAGEPKWMTRFANLFPFVHTEAGSKANFEFEVAHSLYNPNTKDDAYVDNFDFSQNALSMPMTIYSWFKASPPLFADDGKPDETLDFRHQGRLIWHSSIKEQYYQIYGNTGNSFTNSREQTLLKLAFQPNDNREGSSWGGVMRSFTQGFTNQSRKRTLEIVVRGREGTLYADLGRVSEDISIPGINNGQPDNRLQSEVNEQAGDYVNRRDCGLDGICSKEGEEERGVRWECKPSCFAIPISRNDDGDPGRDDYDEPKGATEEGYRVNGTEKNNTGSQGFAYDTEDLDRSGNLDTLNRYLRFTLPLDSACNSRFFCDELRNGWRKYRIPLYGGGKRIDPSNTETEQSLLANVKMLRLWLGRLPRRVAKTEVLLARVNLVGNAWEEGERNTGFEIDRNRFGSGDLGDSIFIKVPPVVICASATASSSSGRDARGCRSRGCSQEATRRTCRRLWRCTSGLSMRRRASTASRDGRRS
jgi:cell surface protein SprA